MTRSSVAEGEITTGGDDPAPSVDLDPAEPARSYRHCRRIAAAHGRSYYLATRLLPAECRPAVHALYAFARVVDDIVDRPVRTATAPGVPGATAGVPAPAALDDTQRRLRLALAHGAPAASRTNDPLTPILPALVDTVRRYGIDRRHFEVFLDSMRMDVPGSPLFRNRYATLTELAEYMRGSAAVIGLQLLPVLGTVVPTAEAEPAAAALGDAFQLTNFLRDIGEDLDRDRIYLPGEDLAAFGVDVDLLAHCRATGRTDRRVRRALAYFIAVTRARYRSADPGVAMLAPRARPAIRAARALYSGILDRIESDDYAVFSGRAVVPTRRRLWMVATAVAAGR
ncbi:phytoene/squalene synthase family protein [Nocardia paucivorans]|uniref:phytoene/squalene synthase family protein n=1 Tax=Nocardia paucivorans TaxID=114259 RepID=UPI00030DCB16|nr:phytoene/squalene synthase family protein [Nocardia paucivorans]